MIVLYILLAALAALLAVLLIRTAQVDDAAYVNLLFLRREAFLDVKQVVAHGRGERGEGAVRAGETR